MESKALDWNACGRWIRAQQRDGQRVVFTNGCFDLLHAGHIHLLHEARRLGNYLVVGVNSDDSVRRLKGSGRPIIALDDRVFILSALVHVDVVVVFPADASEVVDPELVDTPWELLRQIKPDILVKGGDYTPADVVGGEFAGDVHTVPLLEGLSTSSLVARLLRSADSATAIRD